MQIITPAFEAHDKRFHVLGQQAIHNFPAHFVIAAAPADNYIGVHANGEWPTVLASWLAQDPKCLFLVSKAMHDAIARITHPQARDDNAATGSDKPTP